jgi:threonine/homoserine/homoserine lactone efflux protein
MFEEYEKRKRKQVSSMRSIMDYAMGTIVVLFGAFLIFRDKFDLEINQQFKPDSLDKIFGVICLIYGAWRIYRGVKKNYFH